MGHKTIRIFGGNRFIFLAPWKAAVPARACRGRWRPLWSAVSPLRERIPSIKRGEAARTWRCCGAAAGGGGGGWSCAERTSPQRARAEAGNFWMLFFLWSWIFFWKGKVSVFFMKVFLLLLLSDRSPEWVSEDLTASHTSELKLKLLRLFPEPDQISDDEPRRFSLQLSFPAASAEAADGGSSWRQQLEVSGAPTVSRSWTDAARGIFCFYLWGFSSCWWGKWSTKQGGTWTRQKNFPTTERIYPEQIPFRKFWNIWGKKYLKMWNFVVFLLGNVVIFPWVNVSSSELFLELCTSPATKSWSYFEGKRSDVQRKPPTKYELV